MRALKLFLLIILVISTMISQPTEGYYRFPALHGERIIFTAEGDLWATTLEGGIAQRLTTDQGMESNAAISPDGSLVAFSGQYEGPTEVYIMPAPGGVPKRLTYEGEGATVIGWAPEGTILYRTRHYSGLPNAQISTVDPRTMSQKLVPLSQAADGSYEPTGRTLFFTRLPFQGSHTKRYRGGTAQNIWKYATGEPEAVPLTTDYRGTSKTPLWWNGRVYFLSDRDGIMNIWSMKEDGSDLRQHTFQKEWDVMSHAMDGGRIVYQLGADLRLLDLTADPPADRPIPITLASDFEHMRQRWVKKPLEYLTSAHIAPDGGRVALTMRGRIFVAPAERGRLIELPLKEGIRYRSAQFLPDGKSVFMLSDETGELEFWKAPASGTGKAEQLSGGGTIFRFDAIASPDGKWLAFTDKDNQLWLHNVGQKQSNRLAVSETGNFFDFSFSPDSRYMTYVETTDNDVFRIVLYGLDDRSTTMLTSDRVDSYSPVWSPDGKWIYFLSDRNFTSLVGSPWGHRQPEPFFDKTTKIYSISLLKEGRSPFIPPNELQSEVKDAAKGGTKPKEGEAAPKVTVIIDREGLQDRITEVPVPAGDYGELTMNDKELFFTDHDLSVNSKTNLAALEIKDKDIAVKTLAENIAGYELSLDGKKILVRKSEALYVIDASAEPPKELGKTQVNLSSMTFSVDPREEWRQMFVEAWRLERDYFYDKNLHGVDWKAVLDKHLPLVKRVTDRDELDDLIAQMVGELSALHTFVSGGDKSTPQDQITIGSFGAALERDEKAGGYRVAHIFENDPDYPERLSPLAKPGVNLHEGDIIETINGVPTLSLGAVSSILVNQGNRDVLVHGRSPSSAKSFDVIVKTMTPDAEANLRYDEWEYRNLRYVEKKGDGRIGYVHLRAMGGGNYTEWVRNFYPVYNRQGLIIDMRHNRGGNIDSWVLEKLLRRAWFYWKDRVGKPVWNMPYAFRGHMVVLCNERTASDGEAFTEGFRRLGLGKVIGTRTWGGEIWLSFDTWLVDRGIASAAETGVYGTEGKWLIEGEGVFPDTVVDDLPHETFTGKDAQLDAAIRYLQEEIAKNPVPVTPPPAYPDKSFRQEKDKH